MERLPGMSYEVRRLRIKGLRALDNVFRLGCLYRGYWYTLGWVWHHFCCGFSRLNGHFLSRCRDRFLCDMFVDLWCTLINIFLLFGNSLSRFWCLFYLIKSCLFLLTRIIALYLIQFTYLTFYFLRKWLNKLRFETDLFPQTSQTILRHSINKFERHISIDCLKPLDWYLI